MNLRAMREVNTGFGDGLASAFEMVVTPAIFGFLGHLLDVRLGTNLVFTLGFGLFVFGYMLWKLIAKYNAEMAKHLADAPWARRTPASGQATRSGQATVSGQARVSTEGGTAA